MGSWSDSTFGLVALPDGRRLRGRGLRFGRPADGEQPELGVYLTGSRYETGQWEFIWVRWPDFRVPRSPAEAVSVLRLAHQRAATQRVEIACGGGLGRTGTASAILARMAGVPAVDAVAWTRANYRLGAVETPRQRKFIAEVDLDQ